MELGASGLLSLWLAAIPLMASPGPATISLAASGAAFGIRRSLPYAAGVMSGTAAVLVMVALGLSAIIVAVPPVALALAVAAGAYVLYLAWKIATAPVGPGAEAVASEPGFPAGFGLAAANPKAFAAFAALTGAHRLLADPVLDAAAKVGALSVIIVLSGGVWLLFGARFAALLRRPRIGRVVNVGFALMLLASVVMALAR